MLLTSSIKTAYVNCEESFFKRLHRGDILSDENEVINVDNNNCVFFVNEDTWICLNRGETEFVE
jgi:hypothetical protein